MTSGGPGRDQVEADLSQGLGRLRSASRRWRSGAGPRPASRSAFFAFSLAARQVEDARGASFLSWDTDVQVSHADGLGSVHGRLSHRDGPLHHRSPATTAGAGRRGTPRRRRVRSRRDDGQVGSQGRPHNTARPHRRVKGVLGSRCLTHRTGAHPSRGTTDGGRSDGSGRHLQPGVRRWGTRVLDGLAGGGVRVDTAPASRRPALP